MIKTQNFKGFSLAELMIAMVLGIALTGVVIATYLSSKSSFRATEAVSRIQESTRFAVSFLTRDIRMAGYSVCTEGVSQRNFLKTSSVAYSPAIETSVFGWEFDGTATGDSYTLNYSILDPLTADATAVAAARTSNFGAAGNWDTALPALVAGFEPMAGSDIIVVSIAEPFAYSVDPIFNQLGTTTLDLLDSSGSAIASGINKGQILKVGDCSALDIIQNEATNTDTFITPGTGTTSATLPGNRINADFSWQKAWGSDATVYAVDTLVFYVGTGASGSPSLFRFTSACGLSAGCTGAINSELIEGVENLQILYGEDTDDDGVVNQFLSAHEVADFADVSSVKLGLLMRSVANGRDVQDTDTYDLIETITINPPDNRLVRSVKNTTVQLHNKGL